MKRLFAAFLLLISSLAFGQERIHFDSRDHRHSAEEIFQGRATQPQELWGDLYFPKEKKDKYPAIILAPGSNGVVQWREHDNWKPFWLERGYAVFIVDPFNPRGISRTAENQNILKHQIHGVDFMFALDALAKDSRIDANRIGLMGFSRGGIAALGVTNRVFSDQYNIDNKYQFAIAFYPGCQYQARYTGANNPILIVIGNKDDYTPQDKCEKFTKQIRSVGGIVEFVSLDGAYHDFDAPYSSRWFPAIENYSKCHQVFYDVPTKRWVNVDGSPLPFSYGFLNAECQTKMKTFGVTIGNTWRSLTKSRNAVDEFVKRVNSNSVESVDLVK